MAQTVSQPAVYAIGLKNMPVYNRKYWNSDEHLLQTWGILILNGGVHISALVTNDLLFDKKLGKRYKLYLC